MKALSLSSIVLLALSATAFGGEVTIQFTPAIEVFPPSFDQATCDLNNPTGISAPCVVFFGVVTDNDTDNSLLLLSNISVTFNDPSASTYFTLDNTFFNDVPGLLSGDPTYLTDNSGNPPNTYTGAIFGLDVVVPPPAAFYTGFIDITGFNLTNDPNDVVGFDAQQSFTIDVVPEPATGMMAIGGLLAGIAATALRRRRHLC